MAIERQQMVKLVKFFDQHLHVEKELNELLAKGWFIVQLSPMGGGGDNHPMAALVLLEREVESKN